MTKLSAIDALVKKINTALEKNEKKAKQYGDETLTALENAGKDGSKLLAANPELITALCNVDFYAAEPVARILTQSKKGRAYLSNEAFLNELNKDDKLSTALEGIISTEKGRKLLINNINLCNTILSLKESDDEAQEVSGKAYYIASAFLYHDKGRKYLAENPDFSIKLIKGHNEAAGMVAHALSTSKDGIKLLRSDEFIAQIPNDRAAGFREGFYTDNIPDASYLLDKNEGKIIKALVEKDPSLAKEVGKDSKPSAAIAKGVAKSITAALEEYRSK